MLRSLNEMKGYAIHTTDGFKGKVADFYFDDWMWNVRYLVADIGTWLPGRQVLISPTAFKKPDWNEKVFSLNLTKRQIERSPNVDFEKPVSRQKEIELFSYYQWTPYWMGTGIDSGVIGAAVDTAAVEAYERNRPPTLVKEQDGDSHLQSVRAVTGYHIKAKDGEIGHVEDFIADDEQWAIRYTVVATRNWWPGKKVLVPSDWIKDLKWEDSQATIPFITREQIKNSPPFDSALPLSRDYEIELHNHYDRPRYWE